jgi:hypothetical protein
LPKPRRDEYLTWVCYGGDYEGNESLFRACLIKLKRYCDAEKLLLSGYAGLKAALGDRRRAGAEDCQPSY